MDEQVALLKLIHEKEDELLRYRMELTEVDADTTMSQGEKKTAKETADKNYRSCDARLNALRKKRRDLGE